MDSKERDQRAKDGFPERGEILYDADENDERNIFREKRTRRKTQKDQTYNKIRAENANRDEEDDEEDIEELPDDDGTWEEDDTF